MSPRKIPWWPLAVAAAALGVLVYAAIPRAAPDPSVLKGQWRREGEAYLLHVEEVRPDGTASVKYFNPKAIRVGEARTKREGGTLEMRVELQDENYPGCTYTLAYDPRADALQGNYYQAAQGQTYRVRFLREK